MICLKNKEACSGCGICAALCPKGCIHMRVDEEGFAYPRVDEGICIQCGRCEQVCPVMKAQRVAGRSSETAETMPQMLPEAYAAYHKDEGIRYASSSGGIFTLLAEEIIRRDGIVFGAAMGEDQRSVVHIGVETMEELHRLRGSKYLQSDMSGIYRKVEEALSGSRQVLFSGTPCQVAALRSFLGRGYDSLLCVDLVCHGVPSPKVWQKYVSYREELAKAPVRRISFRDKKYGWKSYTISFEFSNGKLYERSHRKDLYMRSFLRNACLRPSCHACAFKTPNRSSDITLADFWDIEKLVPKMSDDKGVSLVLLHTEKGKQIFGALRERMHVVAVDTKTALAGNTPMTQSVVANEKRAKFFAGLEKLPFPVLVRRYSRKKYL